jgi:hypothetical protein
MRGLTRAFATVYCHSNQDMEALPSSGSDFGRRDYD